MSLVKLPPKVGGPSLTQIHPLPLRFPLSFFVAFDLCWRMQFAPTVPFPHTVSVPDICAPLQFRFMTLFLFLIFILNRIIL